MAYDKATVKVRAEHTGVVSAVHDLVATLNDRDGFRVEVIAENPTSGSGADGSKILTVEVHEYAGEIPLFTAKLKETVDGAELQEVDVERGGSELGSVQ